MWFEENGDKCSHLDVTRHVKPGGPSQSEVGGGMKRLCTNNLKSQTRPDVVTAQKNPLLCDIGDKDGSYIKFMFWRAHTQVIYRG